MALLPYLQCYTPPGHISYQVIQQAGRTLSSRNRFGAGSKNWNLCPGGHGEGTVTEIPGKIL